MTINRQLLKFLTGLPILFIVVVSILLGLATTASAKKMRFDLGGGDNSLPSGSLHLYHEGIYFEYALKLHIGTLLGEPVTSTEMLWKVDPFGSTVSVPSLGGASPEMVSVNLADLGPEAVAKIGFTDFKIVFRFSSPAYFQDVVLVQDVGVLAEGDGKTWSFNVPGSPDWSELFLPYRAEFHTLTAWLDQATFLSEVDAKAVLKSELVLQDAWIVPGEFTLFKLHNWYRDNTFRTRFNALEKFAEDVWMRVDELGPHINSPWIGWTFAHLQEAGSNAEKDARNGTSVGVLLTQGARDEVYWRVASEQLSTELSGKLLALKEVNFYNSEDYHDFLKIISSARQKLDESIARSNDWTSPDLDPDQFETGFSAQFDDEPLEDLVEAQSSILFLIDTSGSMDGAKMEAAKQAALESMRASINSGSEVSILGFSGDCSTPVSFSHPFSMDVVSLEKFIDKIEAGGETPLATALTYANQFLYNTKASSSISQAIVLLADGEGGCGSVDSALTDLSFQGILHRHEAVGLGIGNDANALIQLNTIANRSGGGYHSASDPKQLKRAFVDAFENMAISRMLGQFGERPPSTTTTKRSPLWKQLK